MSTLGFVVGTLLGALVTGLLIWIVGKMKLGIEVDGFKPAYLAAIFIAVFNAFARWLWSVIGYTPEGGWAGALTHVIIAAGFLLAAGSLIKGLRVKGFIGALIASLAIAAVQWLINLGLTALAM